MKQAFMVKLDGSDAAWVERQAVIFGSRSLVLRVLVRVVRALIARGSLRWELPELQAILLRNQGNQSNQIPAGNSGRLSFLSQDSQPPREISVTHLRADKVGMEARYTPFLGTHILPQLLSFGSVRA